MSDSPGIADILERVAAEDHGGEPPRHQQDPPEERRLPPEDDAEQVAANLRRQLADQTSRTQASERARLEAETRAARATEEAKETRQSAQDANYTTILSALDARNRESEALVSELVAAGEVGDHRKMGEIQGKIGRLGAAIESLETAKQEMERLRQERLRAPPAPEKREAPPVSDTVIGISREQFMANPTLNREVADWIRSHDEFFTNEDFNRQCVAADAVVQRQRDDRGGYITPGHPEYLTRVERILGLEQSTRDAPQRQQQQRQEQRPPAGAPPARPNPSLGGRQTSNGDTFITKQDRQVAAWMGIDPEEMVAERERLKGLGEIPHRRR